jgi:hypothetical protein
MADQDKETFGNFDLTRALEFLQLFPYQKWEPVHQPVPPSEPLLVSLRRAERQITTGSNEWEQRLFMELIFLEALEHHNIRMWQEKPLDAGESPFRGKVDFAFTPYQARFTMPYIVVAEAKKDDFEQGWGQCLLALKTARLLNAQQGTCSDLFGIVSSGRVWEFGKYAASNQFLRSDAYSFGQLSSILGILSAIFSECEREYGQIRLL